MEVDTFITELEKAVQDYRRAHGNVSSWWGGAGQSLEEDVWRTRFLGRSLVMFLGIG